MHCIIKPAADGIFSLYIPDLPGRVSTGPTRDKAIEKHLSRLHQIELVWTFSVPRLVFKSS